MYRTLCIVLLASGVLMGCTQTPPSASNLNRAVTLQPLAAGTNYYVDSSGGNDANNGTSTSTAWKTLTKVNGFTFQPGEKLLFKAGGVWSGQLYPKGSGNATNIITLDQYDTGNKPRFDGNGTVNDTVYLENQEYWDIKNIEVTNDSPTAGSRNGIRVRNSSGNLLNHIHIQNTNVHNIKNFVNGYYGKNAGIAVEADLLTSSWNDVLIDSNTVSTIERIGIFVGPTLENGNVQTATTSTGVVVSNNSLSDLGGDGILSYVTNGTQIRRNTINGHAKRQNQTCLEVGYCNAYSAGIWMAVADNTVVEENEVYGGVGTLDGTGFDNDFSSDNVKIQYNYSHDNAGGFLLIVSDSATNGAADNEGTVVRYNISQNDGRGIEFYPDSLNASAKMDVYNNTFYIPSGKNVKLIARQNGQNLTHAFNYRNNVVYNLGTATYPGSQVGVYANNTFYGHHDASEPTGTNQLTSNPLFVNPGSGGVGRSSVDGYKLQLGSPALSTGAAISNNGGRDYIGNPVASSGAPDRGAYQGSTGTNSANKILNAGFESGTLSPWYLSSSGSSLVGNNARTGTYAVQIGASFNGVNQDITGLSASTTYTLSGWAKVATSGESVYIGVKNFGGTEASVAINSTAYAQGSLNFTTGAGNTSATIYCYKLSGNGVAYCDDFSVSSGTSLTNFAPAGTLTASSSIENYGFFLNLLNDSNLMSPWSSNDNLTSNHTEWVELNLGEVESFNRVDLYPRSDLNNIGEGFPSDFTIDVWNGSSWNNVITRTGYAKPGNAVQTFTFPSQNTNRIRVQGTNLRPITTENNAYRMQLAEIEVFLQ